MSYFLILQKMHTAVYNQDKGLLKRIGPDKGGYWEVNLRNKEFNSLE